MPDSAIQSYVFRHSAENSCLCIKHNDYMFSFCIVENSLSRKMGCWFIHRMVFPAVAFQRIL